MSKRTRRNHTAELKAEALRRHYLKKEDVSAICEDLKLSPSLFYLWQRNLFANAPLAVEGGAANGKKSAREQELEKKVAALEAKLTKKDSIIAEISAEYVDLKKELGEP
jgi:transposase-like protein